MIASGVLDVEGRGLIHRLLLVGICLLMVLTLIHPQVLGSVRRIVDDTVFFHRKTLSLFPLLEIQSSSDYERVIYERHASH